MRNKIPCLPLVTWLHPPLDAEILAAASRRVKLEIILSFHKLNLELLEPTQSPEPLLPKLFMDTNQIGWVMGPTRLGESLNTYRPEKFFNIQKIFPVPC